MPPLQKLMAEMGPAAGISWSDDAGFHFRSLSPFPGADLLSMDPVGAYMTSAGPAVALGLLMPAVSKARGEAERVKSASNLRQIGVGVMMYSQDNKSDCPPDLGVLCSYGLIPAVFVSPFSGKSVPPELRAQTPEQRAAWVNQNADYVYLGKGKKMDKLRADDPLVYEKLELGRGQGINILFGDGHVEWLKMADAQRILGADAARP
jgi:prepilin-type processing-associated H-X9-DG protein